MNRLGTSSIRRLSSRGRCYSVEASRPSTQYKAVTHATSREGLSSKTEELLTLGSSYLLPVYARPDFVLAHGKGSEVWDTENRKFVDFSAGIAVNSLGHADKGVTEVIAQQAGRLLHTSNVYHNEWAAKLASLLVTLTRQQGGLGFPTGAAEGNSPGAQVFFANSGTEANEGALKIARKIGKDRGGSSKTRIVCFEGSFHGRSMGALSVTTNPKYQQPFTPLIPGIDVGKLNDYSTVETLICDDTCAVIVEPIQGEGGINVAKTEWLRAVRQRCNEVGAVLIFDEIQCGLYRTGSLWAHSTLPVEAHPDIVTMAKPLANGYPVGAVMLRESIAATMTAGTHGTTFGGSPLACAVGHHVLSRLSQPDFGNQMANTSSHLVSRLEKLPEWFPSILQNQIRGRGLILGLGFKDVELPGKIVSMARDRGLFLLTAGKDAVRLVPSLNIEKEQVNFAVDVIESCLGEI